MDRAGGEDGEADGGAAKGLNSFFGVVLERSRTCAIHERTRDGESGRAGSHVALQFYCSPGSRPRRARTPRRGALRRRQSHRKTEQRPNSPDRSPRRRRRTAALSSRTCQSGSRSASRSAPSPARRPVNSADEGQSRAERAARARQYAPKASTTTAGRRRQTRRRSRRQRGLPCRRPFRAEPRTRWGRRGRTG